MNHANSQKLIDVRRRIKDKTGADFAMRINHEMWKKGSSNTTSISTGPSNQHRHTTMPQQTSHMSIGGHHRAGSGPPGISQPSNSSTPYPRPLYRSGPPPNMSGPTTHINPVTPGLSKKKDKKKTSNNASNGKLNDEQVVHIAGAASHNTSIGTDVIATTLNNEDVAPKRASKEITPSSVISTGSSNTPPHPIEVTTIHSVLDPSTTRKKRRRKGILDDDDTDNEEEVKEEENVIDGIEEEAMFPWFGETNPKQSQTSALTIFSYLSNHDTSQAALVCKSWHQLLGNVG